jgi:hypothetical protein
MMQDEALDAGEVLQDAENANPADVEHDYYSTKPGDLVTLTPRRRMLGLGLVTVGLVMIIVGILVGTLAMGQNKNNNSSDGAQYVASPPTKGGARPTSPVASPVEEPTKSPVKIDTPESPSTAEPTQEHLLMLLLPLVKSDTFADTNSNSYKVLEWMRDDPKVLDYGDVQLTQRFAAASLFLQTNHANTWSNDDRKWMTNADECDWYGIECDDDRYLIGINVTANGLQGPIPWGFTLLSETLLTLDLSNNTLVNDGDDEDGLAWIGELTSLRE